ncbi:unnamed protein product [Gongylonema pulchrum]|uniref:Peroxin-19 n=1 Tax=Gongylonema pulchrum TaxID=637853 RepID=A0A183ET71_9BILA|nr:unnamed protein product [Gongylonema pulchrum]
MTAEERKAAESFQNMLKALIEAEQKALNEHATGENSEARDYDRASAEDFIAQLKARLTEQDPATITDESQMDVVMNLVQSFFAKDIMYGPLKALLEKFPKYGLILWYFVIFDLPKK